MNDQMELQHCSNTIQERQLGDVINQEANTGIQVEWRLMNEVANSGVDGQGQWRHSITMATLHDILNITVDFKGFTVDNKNSY